MVLYEGFNSALLLDLIKHNRSVILLIYSHTTELPALSDPSWGGTRPHKSTTYTTPPPQLALFSPPQIAHMRTAH
jgi:hypothetical protein